MSPTRQSPVHRFAHEAMATMFEIFVADREKAYAGQAARAAFDEVDRLERLFSRFDPVERDQPDRAARARRLPARRDRDSGDPGPGRLRPIRNERRLRHQLSRGETAGRKANKIRAAAGRSAPRRRHRRARIRGDPASAQGPGVRPGPRARSRGGRQGIRPGCGPRPSSGTGTSGTSFCTPGRARLWPRDPARRVKRGDGAGRSARARRQERRPARGVSSSATAP